jgi:hypothetical protein
MIAVLGVLLIVFLIAVISYCAMINMQARKFQTKQNSVTASVTEVNEQEQS